MSSPETFLDPVQVISEVGGIEKGYSVADFGSGHGFFAEQLARVVGPTGVVYAIDIRPEARSYVSARARRMGYPQIHVRAGDLEAERGSGLEDASCDVVVIVNILYQTEDPRAILKEAFRVLKPNGRVVVVEWEKEDETVVGPPQHMRHSVSDVLKFAQDIDFVQEKDFVSGKHHWARVLRRPA